MWTKPRSAPETRQVTVDAGAPPVAIGRGDGGAAGGVPGCPRATGAALTPSWGYWPVTVSQVAMLLFGLKSPTGTTACMSTDETYSPEFGMQVTTSGTGTG
jgi:hypothetical protein